MAVEPKRIDGESAVVHSTMQRTPSAVLLLLFATFGSGCQLSQVEPSAWSDASSAASLASVRAALNVDGWRSNRSWTPLDEWQHRHENLPTPQHMRWTFAPAKRAGGNDSDAPRPPESPPLRPAGTQPGEALRSTD